MDYARTVIVESYKEKAFEALIEKIDEWWSTIEGSSRNEGDIFKISFGKESYWKFKIVELIEPEKVVWECIKSHQDHNLKGIDAEWLHSQLYWSISDDKDHVKIEFWHKGLESTGICYDVCSTAWDFYILDSLKNFLETGEGKPGGN